MTRYTIGCSLGLLLAFIGVACNDDLGTEASLSDEVTVVIDPHGDLSLTAIIE